MRRWAALVSGALLAMVSAVGAQAEQSPSEESAVRIPAGQIDAAVGRLDAIADDLMRRTGVPGLAVAVVHEDAVVYAKGFGVRRVGSDEPVDQHTVLQLASVSKPLGATAIAAAVGRGEVGWDDPVRKHLPGFALSDPFTTRQVTIADLYAHRSGLPSHIGDLPEDMGYGRRDILRRLRYVPLAPPLRSGCAYTNFGVTAGGLAAARAQRMTWAEFSRRNLYQPLGMTSTSSRFSDYAQSADPAFGHVGWMAVGRRSSLATPGRRHRPVAPSSSAADLAQWLRLLLADGVIRASG